MPTYLDQLNLTPEQRGLTNPTDIAARKSYDLANGFTPTIAKTQLPTTIGSSLLSDTGTNFTLPANQPTYSPTATSLIADSSSLTNALNNDVTQTKENTNQAATGLTSVYQKILDITGSRPAEEANAGIADKTQALNDITNQINQKSLSYRRQAEAVDSNPNITKDQAAVIKSDIEKQSAKELADLAIIQTAATNNLTTAQNIVDRKIQLQLEPLQTQLEYQKFIYGENKDLFTKAEQRQYENMITQSTRNYNDTKEKLKTLEDTQLKLISSAASQGAPASVLQAIKSAQTPEEATMAAGQYATDQVERGLKLAQTAQIYQNIAESKAKISPTTGQNINKDLGVINDINNILNNKAFDSTFGLNSTIRRNIPGTDAYALNSQINNVLNQLALAARGQLKGQGAVSDFEGKMLRDAQTALKLNLSPDQARKELAKVRGAITTSSGLEAPVKITTKDGVSKFLMSDQAGINKAISDGLTVEYQ